jgi:hypothetical protein
MCQLLPWLKLFTFNHKLVMKLLGLTTFKINRIEEGSDPKLIGSANILINISVAD